MIVVKPINQTYGIKFKTDDGEVIAHVRQLKYAVRNKIISRCSKLESGNVTFDNGLNCFLNIKYALREIEGMVDEEGNSPLIFDTTEDCLTDDCVEALLSTPLSDNFIYVSSQMGANIPTEIVNPYTGGILEGVELISPKELGCVKKKK